MATQSVVHKMIVKKIESGDIYPEMSPDSLERLYVALTERRRVPQMRDDYTWEPYNDARLWGAGNNENFGTFRWLTMCQLWGTWTTVALEEEWPDAYSRHERREAEMIGILPRFLASYYRLAAMENADALWGQYCSLTNQRSLGSPYHFSDLDIFVQVAQEFGSERVVKYRDARTWSGIVPFMEIGLTARQAMALHVHDIYHIGQWVADVVAAYGLKTVCEALEAGAVSEIAIRTYARGGNGTDWWTATARCQSTPDWLDMRVKRIDSNAYDNVSCESIREQLIRGVSPQEITGGFLTNREGADWIADGAPREWDSWYATRIGLTGVEYHLVRGYTNAPRLILDWFARKKGYKGMSRPRYWTTPNGETIEVTLLSVIDELQPDDLVRGVSTGLDAVFTAIMTRTNEMRIACDEADIRRRAEAAARSAEERARYDREEAARQKLLRKPFRKFGRDTDHVKQIMTRNALVEEGNAMNHCVGGYGESCSSGQAFMYSVRVGSARSTLYLSPHGEVVMHLAKSNYKPDSLCESAVAVFLNENGWTK